MCINHRMTENRIIYEPNLLNILVIIFYVFLTHVNNSGDKNIIHTRIHPIKIIYFS